MSETIKYRGDEVEIVRAGIFSTMVMYRHLFLNLDRRLRLYDNAGRIIRDCREFLVLTLDLEMENPAWVRK